MKIIFTLIAVFAFSFIALAQDGDNKEKAKKILDQLSAEAKTFETVYITFDLSVKGKDINTSQEGYAKYKGDNFMYKTDDREVYSDGEKVWTYLKEEEECYVDMLKDLESGFNPSEILTIWEDNFKYQYVKEVSSGIHQINLFPTDAKNAKYHTVTVTVDENKKRVKKAVIKTKDNITIILKINSLISNSDVTDAELKWNGNKHSDVEIIENF